MSIQIDCSPIDKEFESLSQEVISPVLGTDMKDLAGITNYGSQS